MCKKSAWMFGLAFFSFFFKPFFFLCIPLYDRQIIQSETVKSERLLSQLLIIILLLLLKNVKTTKVARACDLLMAAASRGLCTQPRAADERQSNFKV